MQTIFIASDHAGLELKNSLKALAKNITFHDLGTHSSESVDYPDYADILCKSLIERSHLHPSAQGVLICGSGQGMAIRANRFPSIRAALCWNPEIAKLSREHNNANVLVLPGRFITPQLAFECLQIFMATSFAGGRHQGRVDKLSSPPNC